MGKKWTENEYELVDNIYKLAIEKETKGQPIRRVDIVAKAKQETGRTDDGSVNCLMGNLTQARMELGLPVANCIVTFPNRAEKLVRFLKQKYNV